MRFWAMAFAIAGLAVASDARAYTYQSLVSKGCHERIAITALRTMRQQLPALVAVTPDDNDRALIHDIPFDLDADVRDLTGASLAIGVRDNDLHGNGPDETDSLAQVHGDPADQFQHCLRGTLEDEPTGTQASLEDCKAFIRLKVQSALAGLGPDGYPDVTKTTELPVTLMFRHKTSVHLPTYYIEIGRAMHTLEDSFTHNFRSQDDHLKVLVTENYVDYVNSNIVESRDGPTHRSEMDACEGLDSFRQRNLELATIASVDLLKITLGPATNDQKMQALEETMNTYLTYEPGCTAANHWCNAPENAYAVGATGCSVSGRRLASTFFGAAAFGLVGIALLARRRRAAVAAGALAFFTALPAEAQEEPAQPAPPPPTTVETAPDVKPSEAPKGELTKTEVKAEVKNEEHVEKFSKFSIFGALSGSISNPSANGELGVRYNLSERWQVGVDGELNGWYGSVVHHLAAAAFNGYATVVFRTPLRFAPINLRSSANLGVSTLLIDLYGAPSGSTGIFLGFAPLSLEYKLTSRVFIVLSGLSIALPIPKLTGAPFSYSQYRESLGVEIAL